MSYILDALKKSEKERGRRKPSRGGGKQIAETEEPKPANRWRYLVVAALLLNAGLLVWWLRPWQPGQTSRGTPEQILDARTKQAAKAAAPAVAVPSAPAPSMTGPATTVATSPAAHAPAQAPAPAPSVSAPVAQAPVVPAPGVAPTAAPSVSAGHETKSEVQAAKAPVPGGVGPSGTTAARPAAAVPPAPPKAPPAKADGPVHAASDEHAKTKQAIAKAKVPDVAKRAESNPQQGLAGSRELIKDLKALTGAETLSENAPVSRKAIRYHELPSRIRDSMPRISVSMLLYSKEPDKRWINVNGSKMREGQEVSAGLKVEQITPDGAVFVYQGHRFYKAVVGD